MSALVEVKVEEALGTVLDWMIAKAEGLPIKLDPMGFRSGANAGFWVWSDAPGGPMMKIGSDYSPSTNWSQGGRLLGKFEITFMLDAERSGEKYFAILNRPSRTSIGLQTACGPDHLVAAMRAIASFILGGIVRVPSELLGAQS